MHYVEAKGILSAHNGMNLYRGCTHGCIYCDSRSTCYQMNHDFEDVEVKQNAPQLLEKALRSKKKKCMIGMGSMTDPYLPIENTCQLTHQSLEIIERYGFGVTLITKSNRVLQDLDLLKKINKKSKCVVQMTLTTYEENLCKIIEPHVCTTKERFDTLMKLKEAGIPTIVWLCPILPFINDTLENLTGILNYCLEAQVKGILCFGFGLTLRDGDREYFYQKLDEHFPGMKERYILKYGTAYHITSPMNNQLYKIYENFCIEHQMLYKTDEIFQYLDTLELKSDFEQLGLFEKNFY